MPIDIRTITTEQALPLRHQVLWPDKPITYCRVDGDEQASHYGAFINDALICVASIYIDQRSARLRKFATDSRYQGQGIGSAMLRHILDELANKSICHFWCDARESAIGFYQRFGMSPEGERFYKSDVPYFKMSITLKT